MEDDTFLDRYFSTRFTTYNTLVYIVNAEPVATLTMLDAEVHTPKQTLRAAYIYAVATLPKFRRKGLAEALSHYASKIIRDRGVEASLLVPASEALSAYYIKLGYATPLFVEPNIYAIMKYLAENGGVGTADEVLKFHVVKEGVPFGLIKLHFPFTSTLWKKILG